MTTVGHSHLKQIKNIKNKTKHKTTFQLLMNNCSPSLSSNALFKITIDWNKLQHTWDSASIHQSVKDPHYSSLLKSAFFKTTLHSKNNFTVFHWKRYIIPNVPLSEELGMDLIFKLKHRWVFLKKADNTFWRDLKRMPDQIAKKHIFLKIEKAVNAYVWSEIILMPIKKKNP